MVTMFGGPPGVGKTAFVMQLIVDALRHTPTLKALVANVEMPPASLLDQQLARFSGIDLHTIRHRKLKPEHSKRVGHGLHILADLMDRLMFLGMPFSLENVAKAGEDCEADMIVLDYLQRFAPPGEHSHKKAAVDASMELVRGMADCGVAVVVAAVGRQRDEKGGADTQGSTLRASGSRANWSMGRTTLFSLWRRTPTTRPRSP